METLHEGGKMTPTPRTDERLIDRQATLMAALTENQNLKRELAKANQ